MIQNLAISVLLPVYNAEDLCARGREKHTGAELYRLRVDPYQGK